MYGTWDNASAFTHVETDAVSEWAKQGFSDIFGGYHSLSSSCQAKTSMLPLSLLCPFKLQALAMIVYFTITSNFFSNHGGNLIAECKCMSQ